MPTDLSLLAYKAVMPSSSEREYVMVLDIRKVLKAKCLLVKCF
jgi:hypothetical protein